MYAPEAFVEDDNSSSATLDDRNDDERRNESLGVEPEEEDADTESVWPLVRHHSYLPGASHPLYTGLESSTTTAFSSTATSQLSGGDHPAWLQELPVLELPDLQTLYSVQA